MLGDDPLSNSPYRQDGSLGRRDDRLECIHFKHPEIADCECRTRDIGGTQTATTSPFGELPSLKSYLGEGSLICIVNDGADNAFINSNRQGNVYFRIVANGFTGLGCIDTRVLLQHASRQKD